MAGQVSTLLLRPGLHGPTFAVREMLYGSVTTRSSLAVLTPDVRRWLVAAGGQFLAELCGLLIAGVSLRFDRQSIGG
jgi:hypothetical protein